MAPNVPNRPMAPNVPNRPIALVACGQDSGWYVANYSMVRGALTWGRGAGCAFASSKCVGASSAPPLPGFCDTAGATACTSGHLGLGYCQVVSYTSALPAAYRYLSNPQQGGALAEADYCPIVSAYSNGHCEDSSHARANNARAEGYGAGSRCFDTTVSRPGGGVGNAQGCYPTRCTGAGGGLSLEVGVLHTDETTISWVACPLPGAWVAAPTAAGVSGEIRCPEMGAELLCDPGGCPHSTCEGTDACHGGVCVCGDGFDSPCVPNPPMAPPRPPSPPHPHLPPSLPPPPASPPRPPAPPPPPDAPPADDGSKQQTLMIVMAISAVVIAILVGCVLYCARRIRRNNRMSQAECAPAAYVAPGRPPPQHQFFHESAEYRGAAAAKGAAVRPPPPPPPAPSTPPGSSWCQTA